MAGEVPRKHMCQFMVSEVHGERSGAGNLELPVLVGGRDLMDWAIAYQETN